MQCAPTKFTVIASIRENTKQSVSNLRQDMEKIASFPTVSRNDVCHKEIASLLVLLAGDGCMYIHII